MKFVEKTHKHKRVFEGKVIHVRADDIVLPDGKHAVREFIEHPGAVAVIPFIDSKRIVMVKQYRYPVKETTYEIPAGKLDGKENLLLCVNRELEEETGFKAKKIKKILSFWPTAAFSNEIIHVYMAEKLVAGKHNPDEDEFLETEIIEINKVFKLLEKGKIKDSKTVIALLAWKAKFFKK